MVLDLLLSIFLETMFYSKVDDAFFFFSPFLQPNGYKPAPLDLHAITLNQKMEELVELLAENTHNVWAKERIQQGWTYALSEVEYYLFTGFLFGIKGNN